ncbi:MAG TPA: SCO family protein [Gammaproteobacteria bacterium]|nr:SCO family protein [Gammaproteobacteria bacterium]
MRIHRRLPRTLLPVLAVAVLLAGCGDSRHWSLKNIEGVMPPLRFRLTDDSGRPATAGDYRGKVVLLYFGYTHCPDVCPTTLAKLAGSLGALGDRADGVRVLFVSVDPKRDSATVLHRYVGAFGPQFTGLRGGQDALRTLTRRYRVSYGYGKPAADGSYEVSHSSAIFIFDRRGRIRLLAQQDDDARAISHDLRQLLAEPEARS